MENRVVEDRGRSSMSKIENGRFSSTTLPWKIQRVQICDKNYFSPSGYEAKNISHPVGLRQSLGKKCRSSMASDTTDPEVVMDMLKHNRLGTRKGGVFQLFESDVYTSPDKIRCLLTAYAALTIHNSETMSLERLQADCLHHYKRYVKMFKQGYGKILYA